MLSPTDIASVVIAYGFLGRADVVAALGANSLKKPSWAFRPTLGTMLLMVAIWPHGHVSRAYLGNPPMGRAWAVTVALLMIAASWLYMSFMFFAAFRAAAFFDNRLPRDAGFVLLSGPLLLLASLVSPARKAFPPREKFEIPFPWRKRGRMRQVVDAPGSDAELSADGPALVEVIELMRIQAESLGWNLYSPDDNDFEDIVLSKTRLCVRYERGSERANLWVNVGHVALVRPVSSPSFDDFLELEEWLRNLKSGTRPRRSIWGRGGPGWKHAFFATHRVPRPPGSR
jgi:hypothetical protein